MGLFLFVMEEITIGIKILNQVSVNPFHDTKKLKMVLLKELLNDFPNQSLCTDRSIVLLRVDMGKCLLTK